MQPLGSEQNYEVSCPVGWDFCRDRDDQSTLNQLNACLNDVTAQPWLLLSFLQAPQYINSFIWFEPLTGLSFPLPLV